MRGAVRYGRVDLDTQNEQSWEKYIIENSDFHSEFSMEKVPHS